MSMVALSTLTMFVAAAMLLLLSPGPSMAFVLAHATAYGPRGGVAAAAWPSRLLALVLASLAVRLLLLSGRA